MYARAKLKEVYAMRLNPRTFVPEPDRLIGYEVVPCVGKTKFFGLTQKSQAEKYQQELDDFVVENFGKEFLV